VTEVAEGHRRGFRDGTTQQWLSTAARVGLAGVLFLASYRKILEPQQAAAAVQAYQILPPRLGELVGYGLPLVELGLAVLLLLGLGTRIVGVLTAGLMATFIGGVISVWVRGLSIDCGCFGGGGAVPAGEANYLPVVVRDSVFLLLAGWLVVYPRSRFALDRSGRAGTHDLGLYDELDEPDPEAVEAELAHAAEELDRRLDQPSPDRPSGTTGGSAPGTDAGKADPPA
jgi:uncharacterized membrane protein YphA (DoxX/SURF4 family)